LGIGSLPLKKVRHAFRSKPGKFSKGKNDKTMSVSSLKLT